jgi:hypothetical protein
MKITQLCIFAENKPGHMMAPCRLLAEAGLNIRALLLADTQRFGIMRLIVSDWQKAVKVLEAGGFVVKTMDVLAVEVPDQPGGLAIVLAALENTAINIEYMYAFPFGRQGKAVLIFRFDDTDAAMQRLRSAGINLIGGEEL